MVIQEKDITITITNNNNQKNQINSKSNTTNIDFEKCEIKLKKHYNISENESLYILKMDVNQEGYKIPKIQYEVYYPLNHDSKLSLLDLNICKDIDIDIYLPLTLNGNLEQYNPNSDFYNDICNTFTSENGTDLTLSLRKENYINNNLAVCEDNCNILEYNEIIEKVKCSCKTKTNFVNKISENNLNKENLYKRFIDFKNIFNIKILKCAKLIFTVKAFKENYSNIILIVIILVYFICLILFIFIGYNNEINNYIDIITYFTLFPIKIIHITKKKKKEENKSISIKNNMLNTIKIKVKNKFSKKNNSKKIKRTKMKKPKNKKIINPHKDNIYSSNKLIKKKEFQKQIKKNEIKRANKTKINNELNDKMKLGVNIIAKFKNDFNKLTENK